MRYWDSSALVPLQVHQNSTRRLRDLYAHDPQVAAWTLSDLEVRSALQRLFREGALSAVGARAAVEALESLWASVHVVSAIDPVKLRARRLLGVHPLSAADALQLGAALAVCYDDPRGWEFVCLDQRLAEAARQEGFGLLP